MSIRLEVLLILVMVLANGVFSLAEMAVVSSRKARLRQRAQNGSRGAAVALELADRPHDFLATVQVGITLIGTLAGAFGGATIAEEFAEYLAQFPQLAAHNESIAITIVVLAITYLSLIIGELVPKNLALSHSEAIASAVARPMQWLSVLGTPVVRFLSFSTRIVMAVLPAKKSTDDPVTEEEINLLMLQGAEHGTFEEAEQEMVEGVFRLGGRRAMDLMKPRKKVVWLDTQDDWVTNAARIANSVYSRFPVADGKLDRLVGVVHVKDLFVALRSNQPVDLRAAARKPLLVLESASALQVLETLQKSGEQMAIAIDEHSVVQGIVTLTDLMEAVIGDLRAPDDEAPPVAVKREDGSWLVDGQMPIGDLLDALDLRELPGEKSNFATVAGLVLAYLNRIPTPGDHFDVDDWRFEVVDMDRNRVDKVLMRRGSVEP